MEKFNDSSDRTGRLVVANVNGFEILRARPRKRTDSPTPKRFLVQTRMTKAYDFVSAYTSFAKDYFGRRMACVHALTKQ